MYCGITEVPECFRVGNGDMLTYSPTSAFWTFNKVTNFTYLRYDEMIKHVRATQVKIEGNFITTTPAIDAASKMLYEKSGADKAREFLTMYSNNEANNMTAQWEKLFEYLLVKYIDGNIKKEKDGEFERNEWGMPGYPDQPGYPEWVVRCHCKEHRRSLQGTRRKCALMQISAV